jgi:hypothetical protein
MMRRLMKALTLAVCVAAMPLALHAQQPGPGAPGGAMAGGSMAFGRAPGAEFFLAHTGDLQLTDAQVTRLAAIARRTEARHRALRASMDSAMTARRSAPDSGRRGPPDPQAMAAMQQRMQREGEQARTDLRDALGVLTADQQATAWMMVSGPRGGERGGERGGQRGGAQGRGFGPEGGRDGGQNRR